MSQPPVVDICGVPICTWDAERLVNELAGRLARGQFTHLAFANAATLVAIRDDPALRQALLGADVIGADGMSIVWACRLLGRAVPERVSGIDLIPLLTARAAREGRPIYLLGATAEVVAAAAHRLQAAVPQLVVAGHHHGYIWGDEQEVVAGVKASGAPIVLVGIGSPHRDRFLHRWKRELGATLVVEVGGSFDILAGRLRRCPRWLQRIGLEWLFRLAQEPRRLWRRYLTTNTRFLFLLGREWVRERLSRGAPS